MSGGDSEEVTLSVKVTSKEQVADGVVRLGLIDARGGSLPHWDPGAHIDVVLESGVVRQYSLCGAPENRDFFEIAVLREEDSRGGSASVHEDVAVGDSLQVRGPRNHFQLVDAPHYLFIAGGIGITPILAMLQKLGESASWRLVYGGRSRSSMAFRDYLTRTYGDRVSLQPEDECGLLDLETELGNPVPETAVYCCGPEPLLQAVEKYCAAWPNTATTG